MRLDAETRKIPTIIQGEDKTLDVRITSEKTEDPLDITSASEVVAIFLNSDGTYLEKKLSTSGVSVVSGPGGHFQIILSAVDTALLAVSPADPMSLVQGYSDIEVHLTIAGKVSIILFENSVQIKARRFPAAA